MAKLCCMDTGSFIIQIKTQYFSKNIADDTEKRFDTSKYKVDRPLYIGKNKKVIEFMKEELGEIIIKEFVGVEAKPYSYLADDDKNVKKAKWTT